MLGEFEKLNKCPSCGFQISLLKRLGITQFISLQCPKCRAFLTFKKARHFTYNLFFLLCIFVVAGLYVKLVINLIGFVCVLILIGVFAVSVMARETLIVDNSGSTNDRDQYFEETI